MTMGWVHITFDGGSATGSASSTSAWGFANYQDEVLEAIRRARLEQERLLAQLRTPPLNAYTVLELPITGCSPAMVRTQYRKLAKKYHPDMNVPTSDAEKMKLINGAYDYLKANGKAL